MQKGSNPLLSEVEPEGYIAFIILSQSYHVLIAAVNRLADDLNRRTFPHLTYARSAL